MRAGDSSQVSSVFSDDLKLFSHYTGRDGEAHLREGSSVDFLNAIGTPHEEIWDEKLGAFNIKVDAHLAQVWTEYYFFVDDKFSHSGTNFFQLYNSQDGWIIYQLSDTRKRLKSDEVPSKDDLW